MIAWQEGVVTRVLREENDLQELEVALGQTSGRAWNYPGLTGRAEEGDRVYLNTTAVKLGLGSGGYHFVIANKERLPLYDGGQGHIIKLRYTPLQLKVLSAEEEDSPYREAVASTGSLEGLPVVVGTLHSMLAPAVAGALAVDAGLRIAYLMTDGAALPLAMSRMVRVLKERRLLVGTVTAGEAFGGDLETVTVYSGLLAAVAVYHPDLMIVTMGPGIVGTGTRWGTTAIEQGENINAVNILEGRAIALPRISFADARKRHRGLSHHTLTSLGRVALTEALLPLPELPPTERGLIERQLQAAGIDRRHRILIRDGRPALKFLQKAGIKASSMGRSPADDPAFFLAAGAAGSLAGELAVQRKKGER